MKYEIRPGKILKLTATTPEEKKMLGSLDKDLDDAAYSSSYTLKKLSAHNEPAGINELEFVISSEFLERQSKQGKK